MKKFWVWAISIFLAPVALALILGGAYLIIFPISKFVEYMAKIFSPFWCMSLILGACVIYMIGMFAKIVKDSGFPEKIVDFFSGIFTKK